MTRTTNCPNCGAPVDLAETSCPYCDTPYLWKMAASPAEEYQERLDYACRQMAAGFMTPNEARALLGLPSV